MSCCFPFGRNRTNRKVGVSRGPNPFILLVVGIDGVGKTSMVMRLRGDTSTKTFTSWGFNTEKVIWNHKTESIDGEDDNNNTSKSQASLNRFLSPTLRRKRIEKKNNVELRIYDVGGGQKIRGIWPNYYAECHGVIFVINSTDTPERLEESAMELEKLKVDERLQGKPMLILLNKNDLADAIPLPSLCLDYQLVPAAIMKGKSTNSINNLSRNNSKSKLNSNNNNNNNNNGGGVGGGGGGSIEYLNKNNGNTARSKNKLNKLPPSTGVYSHSNLVRVQTSTCIIQDSSKKKDEKSGEMNPSTINNNASKQKLKGDTSSTTTPTLAEGVDWLVDAIIRQWQTTDLAQRIERLKAEQEAKYEEERRKQKERVEKYRQEKAATETGGDGAQQQRQQQVDGGGQMGDRSWSSSNMQAGIWGGIPSNGLPPRSQSKRYSATATGNTNNHPHTQDESQDPDEDADATSSKVASSNGGGGEGVGKQKGGTSTNNKSQGKLPSFPRAAFQGPDDDNNNNNNNEVGGDNSIKGDKSFLLDNNILLTKNVPVPARAAKALPPMSLSGGLGGRGVGSKLGTPTSATSSPGKSSPLNHADLPPIVPRRRADH